MRLSVLAPATAALVAAAGANAFVQPPTWSSSAPVKALAATSATAPLRMGVSRRIA